MRNMSLKEAIEYMMRGGKVYNGDWGPSDCDADGMYIFFDKGFFDESGNSYNIDLDDDNNCWFKYKEPEKVYTDKYVLLEDNQGNKFYVIQNQIAQLKEINDTVFHTNPYDVVLTNNSRIGIINGNYVKQLMKENAESR